MMIVARIQRTYFTSNLHWKMLHKDIFLVSLLKALIRFDKLWGLDLRVGLCSSRETGKKYRKIAQLK